MIYYTIELIFDGLKHLAELLVKQIAYSLNMAIHLDAGVEKEN